MIYKFLSDKRPCLRLIKVCNYTLQEQKFFFVVLFCFFLLIPSKEGNNRCEACFYEELHKKES